MCFVDKKQFSIKKPNKSVLNSITFYLEDNKNKEVNFNGETMTLTLQMNKI